MGNPATAADVIEALNGLEADTVSLLTAATEVQNNNPKGPADLAQALISVGTDLTTVTTSIVSAAQATPAGKLVLTALPIVDALNTAVSAFRDGTELSQEIQSGSVQLSTLMKVSADGVKIVADVALIASAVPSIEVTAAAAVAAEAVVDAAAVGAPIVTAAANLIDAYQAANPSASETVTVTGSYVTFSNGDRGSWVDNPDGTSTFQIWETNDGLGTIVNTVTIPNNNGVPTAQGTGFAIPGPDGTNVQIGGDGGISYNSGASVIGVPSGSSVDITDTATSVNSNDGSLTIYSSGSDAADQSIALDGSNQTLSPAATSQLSFDSASGIISDLQDNSDGTSLLALFGASGTEASQLATFSGADGSGVQTGEEIGDVNGATMTLTGADVTPGQIVDDQGQFAVSASSDLVNFAGPNIAATLNGSSNQVLVGSGAAINETGNNNATTLEASATALLDGANESVATTDSGATVQLASNTTVNFTGSDSVLSDVSGASGGAITIGSGTDDTLNVTDTLLDASGSDQNFAITGTGNSVSGGGTDESITVSGSIATNLSDANFNFSAGAGSEIDLYSSGNVVTDASGVTGGTVGLVSSGNIVNVSDGSAWLGANDVDASITGNNDSVYGSYNNDALTLSGTGENVQVSNSAVEFGSGSAFFNLTGSDDTVSDASGISGGSMYLAWGAGDTADISNGWIGLDGGQSVTVDGTGDWLEAWSNADDAATIEGQASTDLTNGSVALDSGSEIDLYSSGTTVTDASGASGGTAGIYNSGNIVDVSDGSVQFDANNVNATVNGDNEIINGGWGGDEAIVGGNGDDVSINGAVVLGADGLSLDISYSGNIVSDASGVTGGTVDMLGSGNTGDISDGTISLGASDLYTTVNGSDDIVSGSSTGDGVYFGGSGETAEFSNGWINLTAGDQSVVVDGTDNWLEGNGNVGDAATVDGQASTDLTNGAVALDSDSEIDLYSSGTTVTDASGASGGTAGIYSSGNIVDVSDGSVQFDANDVTTAVNGDNDVIGGGWGGDEAIVAGNGDTASINGSIVLASDNLDINVAWSGNTVSDASGVTGGAVDMLGSGNTADISDGTISFGASDLYTTVNGSDDIASGSNTGDGVYFGGSRETAEFSNGWVNLTAGGQSVVMDGTNNWLEGNGDAGDAAIIDGQASTDLTNGAVALDSGSEIDLSGSGTTVSDASGASGGTVGILNSDNSIDVSDGSVWFGANNVNATVDGGNETINSGWGGDEVTVGANGDNVSINGSVVLGADDLDVDISYSGNTVTDASGVTGGTVNMLGSGNITDISNADITFGAANISTTVNSSDDVVSGSDTGDGVYFGGSEETAQFSNGWVNLSAGGQSVVMDGTNNWLVGNGNADDAATIEGQASTDLTNGSVMLDNNSEIDLYGSGTAVTDASGVTGGTVGIFSSGNTVDVSGGSVWFGADDEDATVNGSDENIYTGWTGDGIAVSGTDDQVSANGGTIDLLGDDGQQQTVVANDATIDVASTASVIVYGDHDTFVGGGSDGSIESMGDDDTFQTDDSVDLADTDEGDNTSDNSGSVNDISDDGFPGFPGGSGGYGYYGGYGGYGYYGGYGGYGFVAGQAPKGTDIGSIAAFDVATGKQDEAITVEAARLQAANASTDTGIPGLTSAAFEGPKWSSKTITWTLTVPTGVQSSTVAQYKSALEQAFATWSKASGLNFQEVSTSAAADIKVGWQNFEPSQTGVLGYTGLNAAGGTISGAVISLESPSEDGLQTGSNGQLSYSGTGTELQQLLLHEIGHALGLADSADPYSVMAASLSSDNLALDATDVDGIHALYGSASTPTSGSTIDWSELNTQSAQLIDAMARFTSASSPALATGAVANDDHSVSTPLAAAH